MQSLDLPPELVACYQVFSLKRLRQPFSPEPLNELEEQLSDAAMYDDGAQEFRQLLPYYFEALWRRSASTDWLNLFPLRGLRQEWRSWSVLEQDALQTGLKLFWRRALESENEADMSEILGTAQYIGLSSVPFLEAWIQSPVSTATLALATRSFDWERLEPNTLTWLCQQRVRERAQADFFLDQDGEKQERISEFEAALSLHCKDGKI